MSGINVKALLRLGDEDVLHINEMQSHEVVVEHCVEFMDLLLNFYKSWVKDGPEVDLPVKQVFSDATVEGDFRVMPCVINEHRLKFVKVIGTNEEQRSIKDKISVGKALLIDYFDNYVYAIFDVCAPSSFRTAAISVLALRASGMVPASVALLGAGRIGFYTAYILNRWEGVTSLSVYDPDVENLERFVALCAYYMPDVQVARVSFDSLCATADTAFLSTTSRVPLLGSRNAGHMRFISSVGADADNLSELDDSLLETHRLVTDSMQSMCLGDMKRWVSRRRLEPENPTELKTFTNEASRNQGKILFVSTGVALQDAILCQFIYKKLGVPSIRDQGIASSMPPSPTVFSAELNRLETR